MGFGYEAWGWMFWVELIPATIFLIGLLFIPESPRYVSDSLLVNIISGAVSIADVLTAIALIDKIGHKPLLWGGSIGMAISLLILTYAFYIGELGPVMWVMLGEMFLNQIRGSGLAVAGCAVAG